MKLDKIQLQTISTCNANCVFCPYVESWHKDNPGRMEYKLFKKILKDMEVIEELEWFCPYLMNEPLTDTRIFKWINEFYDIYPDRGVDLTINPSLLFEKNRKKIIDTLRDKNHILTISFHGVNKGSFEHIMQLSWEPCYENTIEMIREAVANNLDIVVRGAGANMNNTILYFTRGHFFSFWRDTYFSYGLDPTRGGIQPFEFHDRAGQIQREERNANKNNFGVVRKIDEGNPFYCVRFDRVLHILYNGDIVPCCMDYKKEIDWLGNINDMSIEEYYNSEPYKKWFDMGSGKVETEPDWFCKRCISPGG